LTVSNTLMQSIIHVMYYSKNLSAKLFYDVSTKENKRIFRRKPCLQLLVNVVVDANFSVQF
jgi:hypothetical protein